MMNQRFQREREKHGTAFRRIPAVAVSAALTAVFVMTAVFPACAYVTGPTQPADLGKTEAELNGYSEERWAELMDNRLEYEEIRDLVHTFNPTIVSAWANLTDTADNMDTIVDDLRARQRDMEQLKSNAKSEGDYEAYANYYMQEAILKASATALFDSSEKLKRKVTGTNRPIRAAERQLSAAVQQLMIAYGSLMEQRAIVADSVSMYEKLLSDAEARRSLGLATDADVQSARTSLLQARSQISSIDSGAFQLKKNLILLCGWSADADPEIGAVPKADPSRIALMDPDADLRKAIANNGTIIDFRHEDHSISTYALEARDLTEEQMNQNLLVNLRAQYQEVLAAKASWEAAQTGLSAAEMTKNAADLQYQLGMLGTAAYLGAITQYQSARTAMATADSTFFQAMETYDWMVAGVSSAE